jgi:hypothetical protein
MGTMEGIDAVVFQATVRNIGTLSLAVCTTGDYVILRNGELWDGHRWPADQDVAAIAAFRRLLTPEFAQVRAPQNQALH